MENYKITIKNPFTGDLVEVEIPVIVTGMIQPHGTKTFSVNAVATYCLNGESYDPYHDPNLSALDDKTISIAPKE